VTATITSEESPPNGTTITARADCPAGRVVLGGGFSLATTNSLDMSKISPVASHPADSTAWVASAATSGLSAGRTFTIQAYALCSQ
jgi:hypothetical protein